MKKLIITVAPNGESRSKKETPYVPIMADEVIEDVLSCYQAGASIVHLHGRNEDSGTASFAPEYYQRLVAGIRARCDIITNISTGGASEDPLDQLNGLEANPEMCSLNVSSVNFDNRVFYNNPLVVQKFAKIMYEKGIKPDLMCYDLSHIYAAKKIIDSGYYTGVPFFTFLFDEPGAIHYSFKHLCYYLDCLPEGAEWNAAACNESQLPFAVQAIMLGGHVRVGLEENIYYSKGKLATNAQLVERIVRIAHELGREIATPDEAREMLGLKRREVTS